MEREKISQLAAEGRREAFMFIKQADLPPSDETYQKNTKQVIEENTEVWGKLWMHEDGKQCKQAADFIRKHRPWSNLTAEGIQAAARGFSPSTSCTDGLPPKVVSWLS